MVINMTSAVLTSTHAVSPVLTADTAEAGAWDADSSARAGSAPAHAIPIPISPVIHPVLFTVSPPVCFVSISRSTVQMTDTTICAKSRCQGYCGSQEV